MLLYFLDLLIFEFKKKKQSSDHHSISYCSLVSIRLSVICYYIITLNSI